MKATVGNIGLAPARGLIVPLVALASLALTAQPVPAQTYGFATLQPATLNHTTASAVAKVLKEKAGLNVLVQPTAGDQVIVPMVARGEAEIGISNAMEVHDGLSKGFKDLRIIAAAHALRVGFFVRKDSGIRTVADLKGKRVPYGFSAMRALEPTVRAILATAESHREGHQAGSRAQCDPQRRRLSVRVPPTHSTSPSARRRCGRPTSRRAAFA